MHFALALVLALGIKLKVEPKHAASLQVMAGDGASEAAAVRVEEAASTVAEAPLAERGFRLIRDSALHAVLGERGVPASALHAPSNSPANTARLVRLRELDVELHWMTVLTVEPERAALAVSALQFHDTETLVTALVAAPTLDALVAKLPAELPKLLAEAAAKFKATPMPAWWRPAPTPAPTPATATAPEPASTSPPARLRLGDQAKLAVLDLKRTKDFSADDARFLVDLVRGDALKLVPRLSVLTRENLLVLLQQSGKELAECEGECEVDTGRRIGADAIVSGDLLKFGSRLRVSLKLHETKGGTLLATAVASGASLDALEDDLHARVAELLAAQR